MYKIKQLHQFTAVTATALKFDGFQISLNCKLEKKPFAI